MANKNRNFNSSGSKAAQQNKPQFGRNPSYNRGDTNNQGSKQQGKRRGKNLPQYPQEQPVLDNKVGKAAALIFQPEEGALIDDFKQLRNRADGFLPVEPCMRLPVATRALRMLEFAGRTVLPVHLDIIPVQIAKSGEDGTLLSGGGLGSGLRVKNHPLFNNCCITKVDGALVWVVGTYVQQQTQTQAPSPTNGNSNNTGANQNVVMSQAANMSNQPLSNTGVKTLLTSGTTAFTWAKVAKPGQITVEQIVAAEYIFTNSLYMSDDNGLPVSAGAGPQIVKGLKDAIAGSKNAILLCAQWFGKPGMPEMPMPFYNGNGFSLTKEANLYLTSWLGRFMLLQAATQNNSSERVYDVKME